MTVVARFEIPYLQFLPPQGEPVAELPAWARDPAALVALYRWMQRMRAYDTKAIALQRTGQLGTYASMLGKEAVEAGIGAALAPEDVFVCSYRENGAQLMRGVTMRELFMYWGGDERGSCFGKSVHDFPICITIASQCLHAAGVAYALKLKREPRAALVTLGDGASSKGDFYEGLNAAGTWKLPLVFVITNNQWAISVPRQRQTGAETLAQKAIAGGVPGLQVDGNDVIAVRQAISEALATARGGGGPTLIEAVTYRLADHTTADDASRYRPAEELAEAWQREPVARLRHYLIAHGAWDKAQEDALLREVNEEVQVAAQSYLDTPPPPVSQMFDHLYATLPAALAAQKAQWLAELDGDGPDHAG
jgi:pyruvate dehydrogenase E1 component alpha subunit